MGLFGNNKPKEEPLYHSNFLGWWIKVYSNRIEFKPGSGTESIPLNQIAGVYASAPGVMKITIETTGGKRYNLPTNKKQEIKQAIYDAQARLSGGNNAPAASAADEIKKLNELKASGIITQEEFDQKKKQLLGL